MWQYMRTPVILGIIGLLGLYYFTGSLALALSAFSLVLVEISVSFDNAVGNASKLDKMNAAWRKAFLWVGILVAVGFMRFYLPLEIVASLGGMSLGQSYDLAVNDPKAFAEVLISSHHIIAGAGGAFLLMVALEFFMRADKDHHWISAIEAPLVKLEQILTSVKIPHPHILLALLIGGAIYAVTKNLEFFIAFAAGLGVFMLVHYIKEGLEALDERLASSKFKWLAGGLGTFIYLEILDASFSLDGVVAAFAISTNIWVVAVGLGVGALFVRSMTIMLYEKGTLAEYEFLENGAFLAILALSLSMFAGVFVHLPEWFIAVVSVAILVGSVVQSVRVKKQQSKVELLHS